MVEQTSNIEVKLHEKISQKLMEIKLDIQRIEENKMFVLKFITNERKNITREGSQKRSRKM